MTPRQTLILRTLLVWLLLELVAAAQVDRHEEPILVYWLRAGVQPFIGATTRLEGLAGDLAWGLRDTRDLVGEVQQLRDELEESRARLLLLQENLEMLEQAQEIPRAITGLKPTGLVARCIHRDLSQGRLQVSAGRALGVHHDTPVIGADGVVGRVIRSSYHRSWIEALTHSAAAVAVRSADGSVIGIATGAGSGRLRIDFVPRRAQLLRGTVLYSSGADGIYPQGIPTARVVSIRETEDPFLEILAVPTADLTNLNVVLLLLEWNMDHETAGDAG